MCTSHYAYMEFVRLTDKIDETDLGHQATLLHVGQSCREGKKLCSCSVYSGRAGSTLRITMRLNYVCVTIYLKPLGSLKPHGVESPLQLLSTKLLFSLLPLPLLAGPTSAVSLFFCSKRQRRLRERPTATLKFEVMFSDWALTQRRLFLGYEPLESEAFAKSYTHENPIRMIQSHRDGLRQGSMISRPAGRLAWCASDRNILGGKHDHSTSSVLFSLANHQTLPSTEIQADMPWYITLSFKLSTHVRNCDAL